MSFAGGLDVVSSRQQTGRVSQRHGTVPTARIVLLKSPPRPRVGRLVSALMAAAMTACAARAPERVDPTARASEPTEIVCASSDGSPPVTPNVMFDYVNGQRAQYTRHQPYEGYPWVGTYTSTMTWSIALTWDAGLAATAQAEADRLAAGGAPAGKLFRHQRAGLYGSRTEDMWLRGLDTDAYEVVGHSRLAVHPEGRWHASGNGTMRLAVLYQTGSGAHAAKRRLGVGRACLPSGEAWWVLLFGD
jgi:hypothetical protein